MDDPYEYMKGRTGGPVTSPSAATGWQDKLIEDERRRTEKMNDDRREIMLQYTRQRSASHGDWYKSICKTISLLAGGVVGYATWHDYSLFLRWVYVEPPWVALVPIGLGLGVATISSFVLSVPVVERLLRPALKIGFLIAALLIAVYVVSQLL